MLPKPHGNFPRVSFSDKAALSKVAPMSGCYRIICVAAGTAYIGATVNFCRRFLQHRQDLELGRHDNPKLQYAWDRRGPSAFVFQVLEVYHGKYSPDCLSPMEQRWMNLHPRKYNIRPAGSDAWIKANHDMADEYKRKLLGARMPPPVTLRPVRPQIGGTRTPQKGPVRRPRRGQGPGK